MTLPETLKAARIEAVAEALKPIMREDFDVRCAFANELIAADPLEQLAVELVEALEKLLATYIETGESGDCGYWDVDKIPEVIAARSALQKAGVR